MVKWKVSLTNDKLVPTEGLVNDGSWLKLSSSVSDGSCSILSMQLLGDHAGASIDSGCDGYFLGNKIIAMMPSSNQVELVGIGYWRREEPVARIKWYNSNTMELVFTEARPIIQCGFFLIQNKQNGNKLE